MVLCRDEECVSPKEDERQKVDKTRMAAGVLSNINDGLLCFSNSYS
jgi:hypothetical protein